MTDEYNTLHNALEKIKKDNAPKNAGIKYDSEKPKMHLVPPRALIEVARGMTLGAKKYAAYNWSSGIEWSRLLSAAFRHLTAFNSGEDIDPDSGLPHLAHAGCCVLMLLEMTMSRPDLDDRDPHLKAAHAEKLALLLSAVASGEKSMFPEGSTWLCTRCGKSFEPTHSPAKCPQCDKVAPVLGFTMRPPK